MTTRSIDKQDISMSLCAQCGANMVFDPKFGKLSCPYCDTKREIVSDAAGDIENNFEQAISSGGARLTKMAETAMQVSCQNCGATIVFIPPETAKSCDFCASKIVAQERAADPLLAPDGVIPFTITKEQAIANLKSWTGSRWFAPSKLKSMAQPDTANSIYVPFWTFDADSANTYSGERGDDYHDTERYYENGEERTRTVTKTNWYSVSGVVYRSFNDESVPASTSVLPEYLTSLSWATSALRTYNPEFLAGHRAQTYQVTLSDGFQNFRGKVSEVIESDCRSDIGGDHQRVHSIDSEFNNVTFKHILTPVYAGAYRFNGKVFQIVVNGSTGEVYGERPYSMLKIAAFVLTLLFVIGTIVALLSSR